MSNNKSKDISVFYVGELNKNLLIIFINVLFLSISTFILFNAETWFRNDWTVWTFLATLSIASIFKVFKQTLLTINLNKLSKKINEERLNTYIYINWVKKSHRSNLTSFIIIVFTLLMFLTSIIYNAAAHQMDLISIYSIIFFACSLSFMFIMAIVNKNTIQAYLNKYSKFLRIDMIYDEINTIKHVNERINKKFYIITLLSISLVGIPFINKALKANIKK